MPTLPAKAEKQASTTDEPAGDASKPNGETEVASAGHLTDPLIAQLARLSALLFECKFREFWSTLNSTEFAEIREYAAKIAEFDNAARRVALNSVKGSFTTISEKRIGEYLDLSGSELASFIDAQDGWKLDNGKVSVPANPDNEIKATVIREEITLDQMNKFLSQAQTAN